MRSLPVLLALSAFAMRSTAAQEQRLRLDEGPLDNTAFLPSDEAASATLARADLLLQSLRERAWSEAESARWRELFDLWHVVLRDAPPGALAPPAPSAGGAQPARALEDADGTADPLLDRRRDGIEALVDRRLALLDGAAREAWTRSQEPLALEALGAAGTDAEALRTVERRFPATLSAARAALALGDLEFESARPNAARGWLTRARQHLARAGAASPSESESLAAALERRSGAVEEQCGLLSVAPGPRWSGASQLEARGAYLLDDGRRRSFASRARSEPGLSVRPGLAFLDEKRALAHYCSDEHTESLALYDFEQGIAVARTDLMGLLRDMGLNVGSLFEPLEPPGWPLSVSAVDGAVLLTVGRRGSSRGNALLCLELSDNIDPQSPPTLRIRWLWLDGRRVLGPGLRTPQSEPSFDTSEFQPGLAVDGERVVTLVREYDRDETAGEFNAVESSNAQIRTWVAALDLASGELLYRRWLGRGVEVQRAAGRFFGSRSPAASAAPIAVADGHALVSSHTGFSASIDTLDGRVAWALRTRRRPSDERFWSGGAARFDAGSQSWAVAPADSDHLYWLRSGADTDGRGLLRAAPREGEKASVLIGADASEAYVLAAHGPQRALLAWNSHSGRSLVAAYLAPDERFSGEGLVSDGRAAFATTRGVYLLDLERELYLLDFAPLERPGGLRRETPRGGSVFASGPWLCVLGGSALWVYAVR